MKNVWLKQKSQSILRGSAVLMLGVFLLSFFLPLSRGDVQAASGLQDFSTNHIVISEFRTRGPNGASDEFIELYNPTTGTIDISGWEIWGSNASGSTSRRATIPAGISLPAAKHYLIANTSSGGYTGAADLTYSTGITNTGGIALIASGVIIDQVGLSDSSAYLEGTPLSSYSANTEHSFERKGLGYCSDTDDNATDFELNEGSSTPQTFSDEAIPCVLINEVAWAGTVASSDDEWIELYSPNGINFDLNGWRLVAEDGSPDIVLTGSTSANGFYVLERAHDLVISDRAAEQIFFGALDDEGEILRLRAPNGMIIDTANRNGGAWPSGRLSPASSMERMSDANDTNENWITNIGIHANGVDAAGNDIYGSPGERNWGYDVTRTPVPSNTPTLTPTATSTPTITPTPPASLSVLINEVGWAGTAASSTDEWIELHNASSVNINLENWRLISIDGGLDITLSGNIAAGGYYLLERTDDNTVSDIAADLIYSGTLSNDGEYLKLLSPDGKVIDTANNDGGAWAAGSASPLFGSMERVGNVADSPSAWMTNDGSVRNGLDAEGNQINGTPKHPNWAISVTATPSRVPTRTPIPPSKTPTPYPFQSVVLNEVLPRPGTDWNEDGIIDANDEFIEIINRGTTSVNLKGWKLDDEYKQGSSPYTLPSVVLAPGERIAIFGYTSHISLSDGGDTVRLLKSNGQIADAVTYTLIKSPDQAWCRFPESGFWNTHCFPTPDDENALKGARKEKSPQRACPVPDTVMDGIIAIECGDLGMQIIDSRFWDRESFSLSLTGHAKSPTWFR